MEKVASGSLVECQETTEKFRSILETNGVLDQVSQVKVEDSGLKGEGFSSETHNVTIHFQDASLKPLNLFVKTETLNPDHTKFLKETKLFEKEETFFMKYIPAARKLCQTNGAEDLLEIYPKCYYADTSITVLEDIILERGFEMHDNTKRQEFEAASLGIKNIAIHHGLSYAMIKEMGSEDNFFIKFPNLDFEGLTTSVLRSMFEPPSENFIVSHTGMLEKSQVEGKEEAIEMLKSKSGKMWEFLFKFLEKNDRISVINHGDYHNNNMMFLMDKTSGIPIAQKLVDLQASRYGSPTLDVSMYMYAAVSHKVRQVRLKDLLTIYLDAFNSTTQKLGHPANLTYQELFEMYCRKLGFGLWFIGMASVSSACNVVLKDIDINEVDMRDFGKVLHEMVQKWTEANPEVCEEDAKNLVGLLREYKELAIKNGWDV